MSATLTKPILLCYDGSEGARHAIETAGELFPERRAIVLYVWSPVATIFAAYGAAAALQDYKDEVLQQEAAKVAEEGSRLARDAGIKAQPEITEITYEGTWHTILDVAVQYDAELVVLGARGLSTFKSLVLGSVSNSVAQHAHLSVLIVPPAVHDEAAAAPTQHAAATA